MIEEPSRASLEHVAIIMDGNGRWAKSHGKNRAFGHRAGGERLVDIVECAGNLGVKYLTLYAFSTENWKRPDEEKIALFALLKEFYKKEIDRLLQNNILFKHIGDISLFPEDVRKTIVDAEERTSSKCSNPTLTVILALNYGSLDEMKRAVKNICKSILDNKINIDDIDEKLIESFLDTNRIPNPDLIIRTSGEYRLSNFLLFQGAYSELYFTNTLWPDFDKNEFVKALEEYKNRNRRFGGV